MSGRLNRRPALGFFLLGLVSTAAAQAGPDEWRKEWPRTDFPRHAVAYDEFVSGGPPKDGIPAIDQPSFIPVADAHGLAPRDPVISLQIGGEARACPLRVLCHEHHRSKRRCGTVREMKEGPSGSAIRSLIPSHRKPLWSKATVVSVAETPGR